MVRSIFLAMTSFAACCLGTAVDAASRPHASGLDDLIARHARANGVPERLVHRVVERESGYNPQALHRSFYGLMQITYPTARSMGYRGAPRGLLDPDVNLTYAVAYLANAYRAAGGSEAGAMRLYSSGYFYVAKRKHLLGAMRTANAPSLMPASSLAPASSTTQTGPSFMWR